MSKVFQGGVLYINGLPVVHAGPGGHASAPEECWVTVAGQKVKKPFVNTAFSQDLEGTAEGVFVNGYPIATMASCTTTSYGDESSEGGVKSGTKQGKLTFLSGSPNVFIGGVPAVRHGDAVILNDGNSEVSTWVQPAKHAPATARLTSDPIDSTVQDHALNIELVRDPKLQFTPPHVAQCFSVVHEQTSHTTFHSFGVFKETNNQFLWHDDIFPAGVYSVTETFPKQGDKAMHIPLGKIKAVSPDNHAPGMKLMPMSFRRQDSSTSSHAGIKPLYPHTYLYIFKDGYLWREITVNHLGRLLEVDLSTSIPGKGRNVTGELTQGIMLPLEDADGKHTFSIAVSVIQWTWAMIHLMGGLNPNDPRFEPYHYLPIEKDQKLISLRLQHINLDALPIDNQLIWHDETIDPPPKDVHPMSPEAKKVHTVPGAAVFVLNDPIGRLIETAEKLLGERYEYLAFAEDNKDKYIVGMLAGTIIDAAAKDGKDYTKHVRESERLFCIEKFESEDAAHEVFVREQTHKLIHWFRQSVSSGQWKDFELIGTQRSTLKDYLSIFQKLIDVVYGAFMLSPEGITFLQEEVSSANSQLLASARSTARLLSIEQVAGLFKTMSSILAIGAELNEKGLNELKNFYETATRGKLDIKYVGVPESVLFANHLDIEKNHSSKVTFRYAITKGKINAYHPEHLTHPVKMISAVEVDGLLMQRYQVVLKSSRINLSVDEKERFDKHADNLKSNLIFRAFIGALAVYSTRSIMEQIEHRRALGDLGDGMEAILQGEIARNMLLFGELVGETAGILTRRMQIRLSAAAENIGRRLGVAGLAIGGLVDIYYSRRYFITGEMALSYSHTLSAFGAITLLSHRMFRVVMIARYVGTAGILMIVIAGLLIIAFTKNTFEQWLYNSIWGNGNHEKDLPQHSIEKFHFLIPTVQILSFYGLNIKGQRTLHEREAFKEDRFGMAAHYNRTEAVKLCWRVQMRHNDNVILNTTFKIQAFDGLRLLPQEAFSTRQVESPDGALCLEIEADRIHFPRDGKLGYVYFTVNDATNGILIGQDAYELQYNLVTNEYECNKVRHELN